MDSYNIKIKNQSDDTKTLIFKQDKRVHKAIELGLDDLLKGEENDQLLIWMYHIRYETDWGMNFSDSRLIKEAKKHNNATIQ